MNVHQNARLRPQGRALIIRRVLQEGWTVAATASALGISERTAYRWRARYRRGGADALHDRSSAPRRCRHRLAAETVAAIARRRRERLTGPAIARQLGMPRSTVGAVLRRLGLGRLAALEPRPPVIRYERQQPGELIHLDIKKLGRIAGIGHRITGDRRGQSNKRGTGWEDLHVAVDDASRLAYAEVLPNETKESATAFLIRALCWFERHGVTVARVMTDNGSCYRSGLFGAICAVAEARHIRTRPDTPRTNGKAERFIQTSLREWAYAKPYQSSAERTHAMAPWIASYNYFRPHSALGAKPPIARLNNVLGFDS